MNKSDIKLMIGLFILIIFSYLLIEKTDTTNNAKRALVYYDNKEVLTIDLDIDTLKEYIIKGYNGDVVLEALEGKIRVVKETSPLHICSYQGWINSSHQVIICLPNKVVIKIEEVKDKIDTVVR